MKFRADHCGSGRRPSCRAMVYSASCERIEEEFSSLTWSPERFPIGTSRRTESAGARRFGLDCLGRMVFDTPFRRKKGRARLSARGEILFYAFAAGIPNDVRETNARILVDLAK